MKLADRPVQFREDITEIVDAWKAGGKPLALRTFKAIALKRYDTRTVQVLQHHLREEINP